MNTIRRMCNSISVASVVIAICLAVLVADPASFPCAVVLVAALASEFGQWNVRQRSEAKSNATIAELQAAIAAVALKQEESSTQLSALSMQAGIRRK